MDTRRLSTADSRLSNRYDVLEDHESHLIVLHKVSSHRKLLYKVDLSSVQPEERKWAVIDYINEYKGLHLLPCMVKFGESFRDRNIFYVAQEVVKYGTLSDEKAASMKVNAVIDEHSITTWLCQILLALQALHARKVVHGAVTIDNVYILGKNDSIRLGPTSEFLQMHKDPNSVNRQISTFKTAKCTVTRDLSDQFTTAHDSMECLDHIAPEMFNATGEVNYSNDIWALGILAFKLATNVAPFQGRTPVHVVMSIQKNEPNWDTLAERGYSEEFRNLLKEMLIKDPARRSTCRHLLSMDHFPADMSFE